MRQLRLSLRAQLFLHARRHTFPLVLAATVLLLGGHFPSLIAGLQLRSSQQVPSPPLSTCPPSSPAALFSAPAPPLVAHPGTDHAAAVAVPSLKSAAAAVRAVGDPNVPAATPGGVRGVRRSPAAAVAGSADALPSPPALNARRATVPAAAAASARRPAAAAGAAAAPAAARARARLAFVSTLPAASSRARGQLQSNRPTGRCSSWSSRCQQQRREGAAAAAAAANSDNQRVREQSWLHRPLLQRQRLAACPSGTLVRRWTLSPTAASSFSSVRVPQQQQQRQPQDGEGAVVEGEKVNGKSVREWTVERTLYQALHMALAEEMQRDPAVCVMGEDVGHYGGSYKVTKDLHAVFGNLRVMDTPICENTFTGMAIGAAMNGLRPVVEGMNMGFLLLAFNQISNNAGMVRYTSGGSFDVPVVIRGPGGVGKQLGPEHSQRIEAYLMAVPGLKMVACSTPYNARGLLKSAIREDNPVIFFEHVLTYNVKESIPLLPYTLPLDRAEVAREGSDVTVLAYGKLRYVALDAAKQLDNLGISTEVVDLVSLKPLDMDSICKSVRKTGHCVILDESNKTGGIGGEILSQVVENCADALLRPPVRLATKDIPTPYARGLEDATIVTPIDVVNAALWMLSSRSQPAVARHVG